MQKIFLNHLNIEIIKNQILSKFNYCSLVINFINLEVYHSMLLYFYLKIIYYFLIHHQILFNIPKYFINTELFKLN
jgi:hypothetical protein